MKDRDGQKDTSSILDTLDAVLRFACDLIREGDPEILSIEDDRGEAIDLQEVALWAEDAKLGRSERGRA